VTPLFISTLIVHKKNPTNWKETPKIKNKQKIIENGVFVKKSNPNNMPALTNTKVINKFNTVEVMNQLIQNSFELNFFNFKYIFLFKDLLL